MWRNVLWEAVASVNPSHAAHSLVLWHVSVLRRVAQCLWTQLIAVCTVTCDLGWFCHYAWNLNLTEQGTEVWFCWFEEKRLLDRMTANIVTFYGVSVDKVWIGNGFIEHLQIVTTVTCSSLALVHYSTYCVAAVRHVLPRHCLVTDTNNVIWLNAHFPTSWRQSHN
jgi:hypothetical protein